jgi:hypothetical protein
MPRPRKADAERRNHKVMIYFNETEHTALTEAADQMGRPVAHLALEAVRQWLDRLTQPPASWVAMRQARAESMDKAMLHGYICDRGHAFWVEWGSALAVQECPQCRTAHVRPMRRLWRGQAEG